MAPWALLAIGAALCLLGMTSIRLSIGLAGFGGAWLLADALGATSGEIVLVACAGAALALIGALIIGRFLFFVDGVCVGAVVGAKAYQLVTGSERDWLLAAIMVPAIGLISGFLGNHWRRPFLSWSTAFAGAALILSGAGRLGPTVLAHLWRPTSAIGAVVLVITWAALTAFGHRVQTGGFRRRRARQAGTGP